MQRTKRGNPRRFPKQRRREQDTPAPAVQSIEPVERARLTLHENDPITGNEDTLYTLYYEFYRGYTIYSTQEGHCCIHGKQGCIRLRGKYVCLPDIEDAKILIKRFRREGYTSSDSVERVLPELEYVYLNRREGPRYPRPSRRMQCVS